MDKKEKARAPSLVQTRRSMKLAMKPSSIARKPLSRSLTKKATSTPIDRTQSHPSALHAHSFIHSSVDFRHHKPFASFIHSIELIRSIYYLRFAFATLLPPTKFVRLSFLLNLLLWTLPSSMTLQTRASTAKAKQAAAFAAAKAADETGRQTRASKKAAAEKVLSSKPVVKVKTKHVKKGRGNTAAKNFKSRSCPKCIAGARDCSSPRRGSGSSPRAGSGANMTKKEQEKDVNESLAVFPPAMMPSFSFSSSPSPSVYSSTTSSVAVTPSSSDSEHSSSSAIGIETKTKNKKMESPSEFLSLGSTASRSSSSLFEECELAPYRRWSSSKPGNTSLCSGEDGSGGDSYSKLGVSAGGGGSLFAFGSSPSTGTSLFGLPARSSDAAAATSTGTSFGHRRKRSSSSFVSCSPGKRLRPRRRKTRDGGLRNVNTEPKRLSGSFEPKLVNLAEVSEEEEEMDDDTKAPPHVPQVLRKKDGALVKSILRKDPKKNNRQEKKSVRFAMDMMDVDSEKEEGVSGTGNTFATTTNAATSRTNATTVHTFDTSSSSRSDSSKAAVSVSVTKWMCSTCFVFEAEDGKGNCKSCSATSQSSVSSGNWGWGNLPAMRALRNERSLQWRCDACTMYNPKEGPTTCGTCNAPRSLSLN